MTLPVPIIKPHALPAGSESCGCCAGVEAETPQGISNRYGLSAIAYRVGDYAQFRDSVHAALSSAAFAPLGKLQSRADDDFTIGLIDAFACAADVLTFYQERIANEFLSTHGVGARVAPGDGPTDRLPLAARRRRRDLARLRPGDAADAAAKTVTRARQLHHRRACASVARHRLEGAEHCRGRTRSRRPSRPSERLDTARPAWNAIRPWMAEARRPGKEDTVAYLAGQRNNLKPGDALLIVGDAFAPGTNDSNWDFRFIDSVELQSDFDRTKVTWRGGLTNVAATQDSKVYALRKRAASFGHNAPMWKSMSDEFHKNYPGTPVDDDWPDFSISPAGGSIDLDTVYPEVRAGGYAVLTIPGAINSKALSKIDVIKINLSPSIDLYQVSSITEISRAQFALSGKVTRLSLHGANYDTYKDEVRRCTAFVQSEQLTLAPYAVDDAVTGNSIPVAVSADGLVPGRQLIVRGNRASDGQAVVVLAEPRAHAGLGCRPLVLQIDPALAGSLDRGSVVVHGNARAGLAWRDGDADPRFR